jgi:hypothetical protein
MPKIELTPIEYNRWVWFRLVDKIKTDYKIESLTNEELEEIFICVIKGLSNRQLRFYFDIECYVASKLRKAVRETKLWETYNRVFRKNNMLFSDYGILGRRRNYGRRKINKSSKKD